MGLFTGSRAMKWRRLHPHRPSPTILANAGRDLSSWVHPTENRFISVREAARLQGFPDQFAFPVSESAALTQIGNAVPPAMAQAVAAAILEALGGVPEVRRRGRPPAGDRAQTPVERRRAWRERHAVETLELPGVVMDRIRAEAARTGLTMAEVVAAALGVRDFMRPRGHQNGMSASMLSGTGGRRRRRGRPWACLTAFFQARHLPEMSASF